MKSCLDYIDSYWSKIITECKDDQQTLIGLPNPFVVPNDQMFQECYYWDTYFIACGLQHTQHWRIIPGLAENFASLMERFGRIPNANRFYFLSRSQPPFFCALTRLAYELLQKHEPQNALPWLKKIFPWIVLEYEKVWCGSAFPDYRKIESGLSRYYDLNIWHDAAEAESGWDMTPRFRGKCLNYLAVDLNCILARVEEDLAFFATELRSVESSKWRELRKERVESINRLLLNSEDGFYYDYDFTSGKQSSFKSIAGFFPLWAGIVSQDQAKELVENNLPLFETEFGVVTTEEWLPQKDEEPKQWAWPNGWAPLTWITVQGLLRYGFETEGLRIAGKWNDLLSKIFEEDGCFYEKYDVVNGKRAVVDRYPDQRGFGWTNAVYLDFFTLLA